MNSKSSVAIIGCGWLGQALATHLLAKNYQVVGTSQSSDTLNKISVLGDVKQPGAYTIPNERITILEAIALAGDINISGKRDNIMVQREEDGQKIQYRVNLLSNIGDSLSYLISPHILL